jgi:3-O-methylgallate 3,4-dioxygenase
MAQVVVGIACSHSPQLSSRVEVWYGHAERDAVNTELVGTDGEAHSFSELAEMAPPGIQEQLAPAVLEAKYARMQDCIAQLAETLQASEATVAVIVGDDQKELFLDDGIPTFAIYWGDLIRDMPIPPETLRNLPPGIRESRWALHGETVEDYTVETGLAGHLISSLVRADFDLTQLTRTPEGRYLGHAFTFPRHRLMGEKPLRMVPVFVNTYFPPNQPTPLRCFRFGEAIADAIASWDSSEKVAIIATGGLSHMVVDEGFDHQVIDAITTRDEAALTALPAAKLQFGTSEALNWIVAAGACQGLDADILDYVPAYRTASGTGVGMTFARWLPRR